MTTREGAKRGDFLGRKEARREKSLFEATLPTFHARLADDRSADERKAHRAYFIRERVTNEAYDERRRDAMRRTRARGEEGGFLRRTPRRRFSSPGFQSSTTNRSRLGRPRRSRRDRRARPRPPSSPNAPSPRPLRALRPRRSRPGRAPPPSRARLEPSPRPRVSASPSSSSSTKKKNPRRGRAHLRIRLRLP